MNKIFVMTACAVMSVTAMSAQTSPLPVYRDASRPLDERVEDALSRMTTQEKIDIIHAQSKFCHGIRNWHASTDVRLAKKPAIGARM